MDLTFQVPMQYCFYSIGRCFYHQSYPQLGVVFALAPSLHSIWSCSPLFSSSILVTSQPGEFVFQCCIFLLFHTVHGVHGQEYWSGLLFPSPVDHVLSELFTMTHPSWVALHSMAHSSIELYKPLHHDKAVIQEGEKEGILVLFLIASVPF